VSELLVEVVSEELPARFVAMGVEGLERAVLGLLSGLEIGAVRRYSTPRRLAVVVSGVPAERPRTERLVLGPPADRAWGPDGPTAAGIGFAKGKGVDPALLRVVDGPKGSVVAIPVVEGGESTASRLSAGLPAAILGIAFPKTMEWGQGEIRWARPIQRVNVVLHGAVVPGEVAGIAFGNTTVGHRRARDLAFSFHSAAEWLAGLRQRAVEPDADVRRDQIRTLLSEADSRTGGESPVDPDLLEEVVNLVEAPTLVFGQFAPELLELPARLLVQSMKVHQRYFPIHIGGALSSQFVAIGNNPWGDPALIARGNGRVLAARFDDARFFLREDRAIPLAEHAAKLEQMRWIRGLGTMSDKVARLAELAEALAGNLGADPRVISRAGALAKADLVTKMVGEFPELQGHMGRLYAEAQGLPAAVALAIEEHWLPRGAGDPPASTAEGAALALADRLDTLVGCFGIDLVPTSGGDAQGLRRAATGLLATLAARGVRVDLRELFGTAIRVFHGAARRAPERFEAWIGRRGTGPEPTDGEALVGSLVEFSLTRFKASAVADGATADLVDAAIGGALPDPVALGARVAALRVLAGNPEFGAVMAVFKRVLNITRGTGFPPPAPSALAHPAERELAAAVARTRGALAEAVGRLDFPAALDRVLALQAPIAALFDAVMVDSPDPAERATRLGLLGDVRAMFDSVADFSRISTR
jgi:glycyl-tRNA synthetase beta chain